MARKRRSCVNSDGSTSSQSSDWTNLALTEDGGGVRKDKNTSDDTAIPSPCEVVGVANYDKTNPLLLRPLITSNASHAAFAQNKWTWQTIWICLTVVNLCTPKGNEMSGKQGKRQQKDYERSLHSLVASWCLCRSLVVVRCSIHLSFVGNTNGIQLNFRE
jgi:hypothetical protein